MFLNEASGVSGSRANVEECESFVWTHETLQRGSQHGMAAEVAIDADQVCQVRPRLLRSYVVQQFWSNEPFAKHDKW
jgi:hypothetical protein